MVELETHEGEALSPKPEAARAFQSDLAEAMKSTVWVTGCSSWYLDPEGTPRSGPGRRSASTS